MEIFKLFGSIFVNTDDAEKSMQKTEKGAESIADKFNKGIKTASKFGTAITAGTAVAGGALLKIATNSASAADNIDKMSQRLGLSRKSFQELDFVLSQSGVDINSFQTGMKSLLSNMDKCNEGNATSIANFEKLGVSVTDASGNLRSQEDVLKDTIIAFQGMEDSAEKSRLAQELFGKQGQEILPLLNSEAGSFEELTAKAHELGLVMSDEAVDAGVEFTDKIDQMKRSLGAAAAEAGAKMLPTITNLIQLFIDKGIPIFEMIIGKIEGIVTWFSNLDSGTQKVILVFAALVAAAGPLLSTISMLIKVGTTLGTVVGALSSPVLIVVGAITALIAIGVALYQNWDTIKQKAGELLDNISEKFNKIKETITTKINDAKEAVRGAIDKIKGFFKFEWALPKLKLPHFSIQPTGWKIGDLLEGTIPKLGIDWYAKAMKNPMIMTEPTAFGVNGNGQIMAGGEAGSEVVSGTNILMQMISQAVAEQNVNIVAVLERILEKLEEFREREGGDTIIPIYLLNELIDEVIIDAKKRVSVRSGGMVSV